MTARAGSLALCLGLGLAAGSGGPVWAGEPMTGAEFEAYTSGKTLLYSTGGAPYGGEDYLPGNRVRWSFLDGRCMEGIWYAQDGEICFEYTGDPAPVCWVFSQTPGGLEARLNGDADQLLYETGEADAPLYCMGPDVGA